MLRPAYIRSALALGAVTVAMAAIPSGASAATVCDRYAATNGSDDAAGTVSEPLRTIDGLADSLSAGQTGCLRGGSYEGATIRKGGEAGQRITFRNAPGEKVTVDGAFEVSRSAPFVTVEGLYLNGRGTDQPSPIVNASDVTFRRNDITNEHTNICLLLGDSNGNWGRADRAVIDSNRIHDCGKLPRNNLQHGIYVEATRDSKITNNWIYDNADYGIHLYPDADRTVIRGNVITGNGMGLTISGDGGTTSDDNRIQGNVIADSRDRANVESWWPEGNPVPHGNVVSRNCMRLGDSKFRKRGGIDLGRAFSVRSNVTTTDTGFRGTRDLRLAPGSRCRASFKGNPNAVPGPKVSATASKASAAPKKSKRSSRRSSRS